jgi:hypothetical protein
MEPSMESWTPRINLETVHLRGGMAISNGMEDKLEGNEGDLEMVGRCCCCCCWDC